MIEKIILDFLKAELTVPVFLEQPDIAPDSYVLFEKTGSDRSNRLKSATFAFQSYAASLYQAATLNEELKVAVDNMVSLNEIGSVRLNSDYNFTDTTTKRYRYQAVYDIKHY